ncbi:MAG: MarR family winged helix-turn-helix transcriptional regulator [Sphingobium sp.]
MLENTFSPRAPYPLRISLSFLVHDVARMRRTRLDAVLQPVGLTRAQRWILIQLSQYGEEGVSQALLAENMHAGPVSLGEKLLLLEALGYVVRMRGSLDRRQKLVRLTDAGYDALNQSTRLTKGFNDAVLAGVSPHEIDIAERVLSAMHANLIAMGDPGQDLR